LREKLEIEGGFLELKQKYGVRSPGESSSRNVESDFAFSPSESKPSQPLQRMKTEEDLAGLPSIKESPESSPVRQGGGLLSSEALNGNPGLLSQGVRYEISSGRSQNPIEDESPDFHRAFDSTAKKEQKQDSAPVT